MSEPTKPETLDRVLDAALSRAGDEPVHFDVAAGKNALAAALKARAEVAEPIAVEHRPRRRVRGGRWSTWCSSVRHRIAPSGEGRRSSPVGSSAGARSPALPGTDSHSDLG